jgi:hypothetical protein
VNQASEPSGVISTYFSQWSVYETGRTGWLSRKPLRIGERSWDPGHERPDAITVAVSLIVHVLFTPRLDETGTYHSLSTIQHSIKLYTARRANPILDREGDFWYHENYDHMVRNPAESERIRAYILNNPVKAGLAKNWQEWPWSEAKGVDGQSSYVGPLP